MFVEHYKFLSSLLCDLTLVNKWIDFLESLKRLNYDFYEV